MMTSIWHDALREAWTVIGRHPAVNRQYRTRRLSTELPLDTFAGLRAADDAPCLIIDETAAIDTFFEVGGMRLTASAGENGPLLVLSLEDRDSLDLFTAVCADGISAIAGGSHKDALQRFLARLDAWRRFLRERRTGLTRQEAVGLIGELLVLERFLVIDPAMLVNWEAPVDGLHDFQRRGHALEIKTSLGPSPKISISSLDQLDLAGLRRLDLVHVRLIEAPDGRTLETIIADIAARLVDESIRQTFENALLRRGLMPNDASSRKTPRVQLHELQGYAVGDNFPRLTRSVVPMAVADAVYTLELRAIAAHRVDADALIEVFAEGGRS